MKRSEEYASKKSGEPADSSGSPGELVVVRELLTLEQGAGPKTLSSPLGPGAIDGVGAQLFLDPQELIVLGDAVRPAG